MWRFIAGFSAVRNSEWAEKKIKIVPQVSYGSAEVYSWHDGNKNSLRSIEAQILQKQ